MSTNRSVEKMEDFERYPDPTELYRRKEAHRKLEARRPVTEKMATVTQLRDQDLVGSAKFLTQRRQESRKEESGALRLLVPFVNVLRMRGRAGVFDVAP